MVSITENLSQVIDTIQSRVKLFICWIYKIEIKNFNRKELIR